MKYFDKIKTYKEIKNITLKGEKMVLKSFIVYKIKADEHNLKLKIGILISKKFGNAVKRNKAKRRIIATLNLIKPKNADYLVFIPRNAILKMQFSSLTNEISSIFNNN